MVVGTRYELGKGEAVHPGIRVMNSLDWSWTVRAEGTGVRIACANQLCTGTDSLAELREVHLSSATDLLAMLQKAIHAILSRFKVALRVYETATDEEVLATDVRPALLASGLPRVHAYVLEAGAEVEASHNALLTRWSAYRVATAVLAHEVGPRVSPERSRAFERMAASSLLVPRA